MAIKDFNMFNIVNKITVLHHIFKNMKNVQYDTDNTNLYTNYT